MLKSARLLRFYVLNFFGSVLERLQYVFEPIPDHVAVADKRHESGLPPGATVLVHTRSAVASSFSVRMSDFVISVAVSGIGHTPDIILLGRFRRLDATAGADLSS